MTLIKSISGIRGTIGGAPGNALTPMDIAKYTAKVIVNPSARKGLTKANPCSPVAPSLESILNTPLSADVCLISNPSSRIK